MADDDPGYEVTASTAGALDLFWRRALKGRRAKPPDVVAFNMNGTRLPLFLFPSVALGPTEYLELAKFFDPEQPWYVLIPPIRELSAGPEELIGQIAGYFMKRLDEIRPMGPVVIGGWSAGVTPALELARCLRAQGREVPLLIAIDMAPENTGVTERRNSMTNRFKTCIHNSRQLGKNWIATAGDLARTICSHIVDKMRGLKLDHVDKLQRASPGISQEDAAQMRRFYEACYACSRPAPYDGKVLVIEASHDLHNRVRAKWESFASDTEIVVITGSHLSIVYWKAATTLGKVLGRRLCALSLSCSAS
jgi:thioesterase domain-containing protein